MIWIILRLSGKSHHGRQGETAMGLDRMTRAVLLLLALLTLLVSPLAAGAEACCTQGGACCPTGPCQLPGPGRCGASVRCAAPAGALTATPTSPRPAAEGLRKVQPVPRPESSARPGSLWFLRRDLPPQLAGCTSRFSTHLPPPGGAGG